MKAIKDFHRHFLAAAAVSSIILSFAAFSLRAAEQWGVQEIVLRGPSGGNPYCHIKISARFVQDDRNVVVPGFWDGGDTYLVRFSPPTTGQWRYETKSNSPELNGKTGVFTVSAPTGSNHGPVVVFDTFYLCYADGTPYHQFGTTCYAWIHQTADMQQQTLQTLSVSPFNKIRFCVFPKSYAYNTNEPERFAFQKVSGGGFSFSRPDPAYWRHLEQRILDLQKLGIQADIILWHPYDRWGFASMSKHEDEWPDSISNDSSSGKLQVGKWTFFAVSYDSTTSADNVSRYFSAPSDAPGQCTVTF